MGHGIAGGTGLAARNEAPELIRALAEKRRQIHIDVQRQSMIGIAIAHLHAQGGDLGQFAAGLGYIDAGRARLATGLLQAQLAQRGQGRLFEHVDVLAHVQPGAAQVEQGVGEYLARAVIGDLAAAVAMHDRDEPGIEQVFGPPDLAQGIDRGMLAQPDFIGGAGTARGGERLHGVPDRSVVGRARKPLDHDGATGRSTPWGGRAGRGTANRAVRARSHAP